MIERSMGGEHFVQIGVTALRDPSGAFLPSVPLYIKVGEHELNGETGLSHSESELCRDISGIFAEKFATYINGCRKEVQDVPQKQK